MFTRAYDCNSIYGLPFSPLGSHFLSLLLHTRWKERSHSPIFTLTKLHLAMVGNNHATTSVDFRRPPALEVSGSQRYAKGAWFWRHSSPHSTAVTIEVLGHQLQFSQDPNSKHLGATVWDGSVVFVKFLEKNSRKGRFCPNKLKGKHAIELGAGCGLAGFGMALLGCDVVSTDQVDVLSLLTRNIERNTSRVKQTNPEATLGCIQVKELDWGNPDHIRAVDPPFDYIIGTDIVYSEHLLEPLLKTIFALSGPKTTLLLGYEIRSTTLHDQMIRMWKSNFEVKTIPEAKMDSKYRHPSIQLYMMGLKPQGGWREHKTEGEQSDECRAEEEAAAAANSSGVAHAGGKHMLTDWEARRMGSMAARLLRDIKITDGK